MGPNAPVRIPPEMATVTAANDDPIQHDPAESRQPLEATLLTPGVVEAVRALVEIMERGGLTKLDLTHGDLSVRLRSDGSHRPAMSADGLPPVPAMSGAPEEQPETNLPAAVEGGYAITSPMVGTFYNAPSPGARPFVEVGDRVEVGQTVGIVEAMKIMNEIAAERAGVVAAILIENGQPVEYGSPLIRLA